MRAMMLANAKVRILFAAITFVAFLGLAHSWWLYRSVTYGSGLDSLSSPLKLQQLC
jgi:hypothetical protein